MNEKQLNGEACVTCGVDFTNQPSVPVDIIDGAQVFQCSDHQ